MKKTTLLLALISLILFVGCSKDEEVTPVAKNPYVGTKWTAPDDISQAIYGGKSTTSIEFLTETTGQQIDVQVGGIFGSSNDVYEATCKFWGDSVSWTADNYTMKGKITGSTIVTTMGTLSGGKRTYVKQ